DPPGLRARIRRPVGERASALQGHRLLRAGIRTCDPLGRSSVGDPVAAHEPAHLERQGPARGAIRGGRDLHLRILLTGRQGQVGWELERALAPLGELVCTDRATLDLADADAIRRVVRTSEAELIVNAAAYTAVDRAESEAQLAMQVNGVAPGVLAEEAVRLGAWVIHFLTDYVFVGAKTSPYQEGAPPNPLNAYGRSKLAGEQAIQRSGARYLILRTSWVYAPRGNNFFRTILRAAREGAELRVVEDQVG